MTSSATFTCLPKAAVAGLREAAAPQRRGWFRPAEDGVPAYLREHGREVAQYSGPGVVVATALCYLEEQHQMDLMRSEYDQLAQDLSEQRGATYFFLTEQHRNLYEKRLSPAELDAVALRDYFNEFNQESVSAAGDWMKEAMSVLWQSLTQVGADSVILIGIG